MRSDPRLDQDPVELAGTTPYKKKAPRTWEAFFFFAEHPVPTARRSSFRARWVLVLA
jgi:hypothetical protein